MNDDSPSQGTSVDARIEAYHSPTPPPAAEATQPEPMPSSDQQPTDAAAPVTPEGAQPDDLTLPEGVSERTKQQFEKLKSRLQQAEAKASPPVPKESSVFDTFRPEVPEQVATEYPQQLPTAAAFQNLNQQQVDAISQNFVDQYGNVDIQGLNQALRSANGRAANAEMQVRTLADRITRYEENQQVREAHAVYPQLDPQAKDFDPTFFELTRDRLLRNMYEGKNQSLLEVASTITKAYKPATPPVNVEQVEKEAVAKYEEAQQARNQGPLTTGKGEDRQPQVSYTELRERTRKGDAQALDERLKAVGIIK